MIDHQILSLNNEMSDFISVSSPQSRKNLLLLIDTEAQISILKQSLLNENVKIDTNDIISIKGITDERQSSLGSVKLTFIFKHLSIVHKVHVVPNNFQIPAHGIIGKDFLKINKCQINYDNMTLTVKPSKSSQVTIDIRAELMRGLSVLPPKSETFKLFRIKSQNFPCVIETQELSRDIFTPTSIAYQPETWLRVLNTSEETRFITTDAVKASNLDDFHILKSEKTNKNNPRRDNLSKILSSKIPEHALDKLLPLCLEYSDIFYMEGDKSSVNNFYVQKLRLNDKNPVFVKQYRLPHSQKEEIRKQVANLLKQDLIEMSTSNYNSPLIVVPKKSTDGSKKWRMCVDFKLLNRKLIPDKFPLPRIDEILDGLGKARYFSCLDLHSGYHQIPLHEKSRHLTSFATEKGFYQWKVVPFGLNVAPSSFTRMMTIAFSGLSPEQAFIYMDDLIVIGYSDNQHIRNLTQVFETCKKYNLKLNPLKCEFFRTEVQFLGHRCTSNGILPDPSKLNVLEKYPTPKDKKETKRFVAFANYYRRFIKNFSAIAKPLNELSRKRKAFIWSQECETAFVTLKKALLSAPILAYPDFSKEFKVTVDASQLACGAVLSMDINGCDRPISFISRTFKKGELNKPIIEKELLAIHFALMIFRPYLYGRRFTVYSDHKPLVYLYKLKNPTSKLSRIRLDLEEFLFDVIYIKGELNVVSDALSRISIAEIRDQYKYDILAITRSKSNGNKDIENEAQKVNDNIIKAFESLQSGFDRKIPRVKTTKYLKNGNDVIHCTIAVYSKHRKLFDCSIKAKDNEKLSFKNLLKMLEKEATAKNIEIVQWALYDQIFDECQINDFKQSCNEVLKNIKIQLIKKPESVIDKNKQLELINFFHNDPIYGGHCGQKRMYANLRSRYYWPGMNKSIAKFCKNCHICKLAKPSMGTKQPLCLTETPQKPFDLVQIDTIGPMRTKSLNGNLYAVTIICELTKYLIAIPIPNNQARTVADAIMHNFILIHGPMRKIKTDMGKEYLNSILVELCKLLKIEYVHSTAHHHETVGVIERSHRVLNEYLRSYCNGNLENWDIFMTHFAFCYNIAKNTSNGCQFSPFELIFGRQSNLPSDFGTKIAPVYNFDNYAFELKYRMEMAHKETAEYIKKIKVQMKSFYDKYSRPINFCVGDRVKVRNEPYDKFKFVYSGPFNILEVKDENLVIDLNGKRYKIHKNRVIKYD